MPQPSSTRQVSSTGLSRRCCLRASPDRPTRLRLAVPKWTRRQGEETPLGPSSGEETPISQDGMSYRVRSLPSSLFHPSNRALPSDCVARVEKLCPRSLLAQVLARVSYQLLLAAPRSCLLEPFGPSPVHVCAKPVRSSSPGFAFTGGQRAAWQGLSEASIGQRLRRLHLPQTDNLKRLKTFLLRLLTRPEQRLLFERQANRSLPDLQGSRSSSSTSEDE